MIDELTRLNNEVYRLLSELDKYSAAMGDEMRDEMRAVILQLYKSEADLLMKKLAISVATENFECDRQMDYLVPQRWRTRFFRRRRQNAVADLIEARVQQTLAETLQQMQKDLSRTDAQEDGAEEEQAEAALTLPPSEAGEEISWDSGTKQTDQAAVQPEKAATPEDLPGKATSGMRRGRKRERSPEDLPGGFEQLTLSLTGDEPKAKGKREIEGAGDEAKPAPPRPI